MKILIVSMKFPPSIGGGETIAYNQAVSLSELGHDIAVLTEKHPHSLPNDNAGNRFKLIRSQAINNIAAGHIDLTASMNELARILRDLNPDIIHVHNYQAAIAVFIISSGLRAKIVFTQHATPIPEIRKIIGYLGDYEYEDSIARFCYKDSNYDASVEISDVYVNWALQCGARRDKVHKLYPGIDLKRWKPRPTDNNLKINLGLSSNNKVVLAPIRFVARKGVLDFLESARYLKDPSIKLLLCGTVTKTDADVKAKMDYLLNDPQIASKVIMQSEGTSLHNMMKYYSIADLLCLPSHMEGLGIVLLEAMAMKIPVLATAVPGISEIVTGNITGSICEPRSPQKLAQAIEQSLNAPISAKDKLIENAYEMVKERFNLELQTKRLVAIYEVLLDS